MHSGNRLDNGHCTAYVAGSDGEWYHVDDERVHLVDAMGDEIHQDANVVLYRLRTPSCSPSADGGDDGKPSNRKNDSNAGGSDGSDDSDATERGEMSPALLSCASSHDDPQDSDATVAETNMQQEAQSNSVDSNANNSSSADADSASDGPPTQPEDQPVATRRSTKRKRGGVKAKKEQEKTSSMTLRRSARVS